ncbi:MAG TPA: hypothetical protein DCQ06_12465 [Myxococcales bacterium]|nr:hypothetical protein [Myxococcales bacterium]HAN32400.1 hypothetical protein [Myxococcales bacterium]
MATQNGQHFDSEASPKNLEVVAIDPPAQEYRRKRRATFAKQDERRNRYHLPTSLQSGSPVGFRHRVSLQVAEAQKALELLSLNRPLSFVDAEPVTDAELFDEVSLGVLSARQSTNFRGQKQVTLGPEDSQRVAHLLQGLQEREADVLDRACMTHVVMTRPYRTPFTALLTLVGHRPGASILTVPWRLWNKRTRHLDDIPTIGYLRNLHLGILADAMERAAVIASEGRRRAQIFMAPFCGSPRQSNKPIIRALEELCGLKLEDKARGWRVSLVAQVGVVSDAERIDLDRDLWRRIGANLIAFRSERVLPGVNAESKAPAEYQQHQSMDVPDGFTVQAGRAAYNAFAHWTGLSRETAKDVLLMDRIDVLSHGGAARIKALSQMLESVTDEIVNRMPKWIDIPAGRIFSRNANKSRKAFALVGQRVYITGISRRALTTTGVDWELALQACGAAAARGALYAELMGVVELPQDCDLLAGICLMAGPVNQNDIGKQFYGHQDLLTTNFADQAPTSLLIWTLKAKTVADPIGNEEQLLNEKRKGALVDLRPAPHEMIKLRVGGLLSGFRDRGEQTSSERAFADVDNFVVDDQGCEIPGNRGQAWPDSWRNTSIW